MRSLGNHCGGTNAGASGADPRPPLRIGCTAALPTAASNAAVLSGNHDLAYTEEAAAHFVQLRQAKLRIGTQDLRIAAIALVHGATVVTRNWRDFRHVPGLALEDWSI